jgi:hypothetical protein
MRICRSLRSLFAIYCGFGMLPLGTVPTGQGPVMGFTPGCTVVLVGATGVDADGELGLPVFAFALFVAGAPDGLTQGATGAGGVTSLLG